MRRHNQNRKVIKIVISMAVACFVCWTPYFVDIFVQIANADFLLKDKRSTLRTLAHLFPLLSTVIDPVILFLFSTNYRSALRIKLTSCRSSQCKYSCGRLAPQNERELELAGTRTAEVIVTKSRILF